MNIHVSHEQLKLLISSGTLSETQKKEYEAMLKEQSNDEEVKQPDHTENCDVTPDSQMKELNAKKLDLFKQVGYEFLDPLKADVMGVLTFTQCLAAYQETTLAIRTNQPEDMLNILAACAYNTNLHDRLVSREACWTAKGKPHFKTMGALYDDEAKELFRTEFLDEKSRGSQYVVVPTCVENVETSSKVFIGLVSMDLKGSCSVEWDQMPVDFNRAKNDINSLQYELLIKFRDDIKLRAVKMQKYAPKNMSGDKFKHYAFILAVASYFDHSTFNAIFELVNNLIDEVNNGDLVPFVKAVLEILTDFKKINSDTIPNGTIASSMENTRFSKMSVNRLSRYFDRLNLKSEPISFMGNQLQGFKIEELEKSLKEFMK